MRWAPALVVKFSSLQVSPDSQYSTGGGVSRSGGKKMLNVMAQFRTGSDDASVVAGRQNSDALQAVPCKAPRKGCARKRS
jgi:hypothetical protein